MATYIVMAKYTPATLAEVRKAGYASRIAPMRAAVESAGGTMRGDVIFLDGTEWDFVGIADGDADLNFAFASASAATGAFEKIRYLEGRSAEEMDALMARQFNWTPPGS